ncbi:DUF6221 family protein [Rhodococcoides fascians]|uniref:DUF6221 family protein n=1 Tax=Rhodococcoides fascians TaxID=1828 RepID=UPI0023F87376
MEFLKARLDEDEQVAMTAANGKPENYGRWDYGGGDYHAPGRGEVYAPDASGPDSTGFMDYHYVTCDSEGLLPAVETEQATHIVRHDPARVLREVAAKRRLIADFADQSCLMCSSMSGGDVLSDNVLRTLASAYRDHPEYERVLWETR